MSSLRRNLLLATAGIIVVGLAGGAFVAMRSGSPPAPAVAPRAPAVPAAAATGAPAAAALAASAPATEALAAAADALGFRQTTASDVGVVENLPADTTLLAPSKSVLPVGAIAPDFTLSTATGEKVH